MIRKVNNKSIRPLLLLLAGVVGLTTCPTLASTHNDALGEIGYLNWPDTPCVYAATRLNGATLAFALAASPPSKPADSQLARTSARDRVRQSVVTQTDTGADDGHSQRSSSVAGHLLEECWRELRRCLGELKRCWDELTRRLLLSPMQPWTFQAGNRGHTMSEFEATSPETRALWLDTRLCCVLEPAPI